MKIIYRSMMEAKSDGPKDVLLRGYATTAFPDLERVSVIVRPESISHLNKYGRLTMEHKGESRIVGDVLSAVQKDKDGYGGVYIESKLFPNDEDAPEEVKRAHYIAKNAGKGSIKPLAFSIEASTLFKRTRKDESHPDKEPIQEVLVNLHPLVAFTGTPYNPQTNVEVLERGFSSLTDDDLRKGGTLEVWSDGTVTIARGYETEIEKFSSDDVYDERYEVYCRCGCGHENLVLAKCDSCGGKFLGKPITKG